MWRNESGLELTQIRTVDPRVWDSQVGAFYGNRLLGLKRFSLAVGAAQN